MKKASIKYIGAVLLCALTLVINTKSIQAEDASYLTTRVPWVSETACFGEKGLTWNPNVYMEDGSISSLSYEVELADNAEFANPQKYTTTKTELALKKDNFGQQGGRYYARVRNCITTTDGQQLYSGWSETREFIFVAITKKNFPGLHRLLKEGGWRATLTGGEKMIYDKNGDEWLDPEEIREINSLDARNKSTKRNGKYVTKKAVTISSLDGIQYLPELVSISFDHFSGTKIDVSGTKVNFLNINGATAKNITIIAPDAKTVSLQSDMTKKVKSIDVSQCNSAVDLLVYGNNGTKTVKLPKNKNKLKILSLSDFNINKLNLNGYKNLRQLYVYHTSVKSVQVKKCQKLNYIYFYYCKKIGKLDLKSNKKLVGADVYKTPSLTRSTVKRPKGAKVTWGKGKWWYSTKKYKNLMKNIFL